VIVFPCESCGLPMSMPDCDAGERVSCAMCKAVMVIPSVSDQTVKPVRLRARKISSSTYQVDCPRCDGTTNFRESSLGRYTKCRNCGFKMKLPPPPDSGGSGCLGVMLVVGLVVSLAVGSLL
jgi:uncharacterized protein (DUF983 family)